MNTMPNFNEMRIVDLFSGIGGFSLGLHRASEKFKTIAFCEMDPFCTQILNKHWPDVPVYPDIRELTYEKLKQGEKGEPTRRTIDIVCGGFPCQPFSQAGKRRGKDDDRDLWPEMFRIIKECEPTWVIGENVAGFINMELDRTVADLEGEGYEVRVFVLGACAVQAPHQRQRCWIIGRKRNLSDPKCNGLTPTEVEGSIAETVRQKPQGQNNSLDSTGTSGLPGTESNVPHSKSKRTQRGIFEQVENSELGKDGEIQHVADSEGIGHRRGDRQKCGTAQRELQPEERKGSALGSQTQGCGESFSKDVADSEIEGGQRRSTGKSGINPQCEKTVSGRGGARDVADSGGARSEAGLPGSDSGKERITKESNDRDHRQSGGEASDTRPTQRGMGDLADGLSAELLNIGSIWNIEPDIPRVTTGEKNRVKKLKALGNSVVPQIPEIIGRLIMEVEREIQ
jgi:DNA-cytosine methyltransferase